MALNRGTSFSKTEKEENPEFQGLTNMLDAPDADSVKFDQLMIRLDNYCRNIAIRYIESFKTDTRESAYKGLIELLEMKTGESWKQATLVDYYRAKFPPETFKDLEKQLFLDTVGDVVASYSHEPRPKFFMDDDYFLQQMRKDYINFNKKRLLTKKVPPYFFNHFFDPIRDRAKNWLFAVFYTIHYSNLLMDDVEIHDRHKFKRLFGFEPPENLVQRTIEWIDSHQEQCLPFILETIRETKLYWMFANFNHEFFRLEKCEKLTSLFTMFPHTLEYRKIAFLYKRRLKIKDILTKKELEIYNKKDFLRWMDICLSKHHFISIANEDVLKFDILDPKMFQLACKHVCYFRYRFGKTMLSIEVQSQRWANQVVSLTIPELLKPEPRSFFKIASQGWTKVQDCFAQEQGFDVKSPFLPYDDACFIVADQEENRDLFAITYVEALDYNLYKKIKPSFIESHFNQKWWEDETWCDYMHHHPEVKKKFLNRLDLFNEEQIEEDEQEESDDSNENKINDPDNPKKRKIRSDLIYFDKTIYEKNVKLAQQHTEESMQSDDVIFAKKQLARDALTELEAMRASMKGIVNIKAIKAYIESCLSV